MWAVVLAYGISRWLLGRHVVSLLLLRLAFALDIEHCLKWNHSTLVSIIDVYELWIEFIKELWKHRVDEFG